MDTSILGAGGLLAGGGVHWPALNLKWNALKFDLQGQAMDAAEAGAAVTTNSGNVVTSTL